jgi:cyclopropane fatty-acyl-phospholipid synthase-like methyltransferase
MMMNDARQHAPATARNREPILNILRKVLPAEGTVLEIASGTGEHAVHFAAALPGLTWQPSDPSAEARASIAAWIAAAGLVNLVEPLALDAAAPDWPIAGADAVVCINMVHISPWIATEGLMQGAARVLPMDGPLVLYGPYRRAGRELEPSNAAFDESLRQRDPAWGLRLLEDVVELAGEQGLALDSVNEMPANNLTVVLRRRDK